jgi:hypothetical protein
MITILSKYAKVFALAITLLFAVPVAVSAAPEDTGSSAVEFAQNSNRAFNGGGTTVRRRTRRRAVRPPRRRARRHRHNHAVIVRLTR